MISVYLNQQLFKIPQHSNLQEVLHLSAATYQDLELANIAVVVNQHIIPQSEWQQTICQLHDQIELFTAVTGG